MTAHTELEAEERRLWADFYDATSRALEIMRAEGTGAAVLERVATQQALANNVLTRIKEIRELASHDQVKA